VASRLAAHGGVEMALGLLPARKPKTSTMFVVRIEDVRHILIRSSGAKSTSHSTEPCTTFGP
jgi:hypothetical protein